MIFCRMSMIFVFFRGGSEGVMFCIERGRRWFWTGWGIFFEMRGKRRRRMKYRVRVKGVNKLCICFDIVIALGFWYLLIYLLR